MTSPTGPIVEVLKCVPLITDGGVKCFQDGLQEVAANPLSLLLLILIIYVVYKLIKNRRGKS